MTVRIRRGVSKFGMMIVKIDDGTEDGQHFDIAAPVDDVEEMARNILKACKSARKLTPRNRLVRRPGQLV